MTRTKMFFLFCLPALCIAEAVAEPGAERPAATTLIVGPGEALALTPPEADARLEVALDGGPLRPVLEDVTAPQQGDHWLAVAGRDPAGNLSPIRWVRLRVDHQPPDVALTTEPEPIGDRRWLPPRATVTASAGDDLAGVARLALTVGDDVAESTEPRVSVELPAAGEVTARARAVDHAGIVSEETTLELSIDSTPPTGTIDVGCSPAPGVAEVVVAPDCRIDVEVLDHESGVASWTARVDGEDAAREKLTGPWPAGSHTVTVAALDAVGNQAEIGPFAFIADDQGPEITWRADAGVSGAGGETFYRSPVTVTAEAEDSPAGLARLLASTDGESFGPVDGPLDVVGERLMLRAVDGVGNTSEAEASWRLDQTPPEIRLEIEGGEAVSPGGPVNLERGQAIRFDVIDHGAGVETSTYSLSVVSADLHRGWWWWPPRDEPLPERLDFPWPGEIELTVQAVDRLGNRQTSRWSVVVRRAVKGRS